MKQKLEVAANVAVILLAGLVCFAIVRTFLLNHPLPTNQIKAGDEFQIQGVDWSQHQRTIVLCLRNGCSFCEESVPFYQRLVEMQKGKAICARILAVFPDSPKTVQTFLQSQGLSVDVVSGASFSALKVSATPTLAVVDRQGRVVESWLGVLSPRDEETLIALVRTQEP